MRLSLSLCISFSLRRAYNNIDVSLVPHTESGELELVLGACMANEEVLPSHRGGQLPADLRGTFYAYGVLCLARTHTRLLFIDLPDFQSAYRYGSLDAASHRLIYPNIPERGRWSNVPIGM